MTLFFRELVKVIQYPNKDFFIIDDEVDYNQRSHEAGAYIVMVFVSRYIDLRLDTYGKIVLGKKSRFLLRVSGKNITFPKTLFIMYKKKFA